MNILPKRPRSEDFRPIGEDEIFDLLNNSSDNEEVEQDEIETEEDIRARANAKQRIDDDDEEDTYATNDDPNDGDFELNLDVSRMTRYKPTVVLRCTDSPPPSTSSAPSTINPPAVHKLTSVSSSVYSSSRILRSTAKTAASTSDVTPVEVKTTESISNVSIKRKPVQIEWRHIRNRETISTAPRLPSDSPIIQPVKTPLQYFRKYLPHTFFEDAAHFTNLYSVQNETNFQPTSANELEVLFALHTMMGIMKFPRIEMYWASATAVPFFTNHMTRNRFYTLRSHLHLIDNNQITNETDRLIKVRPIMDAVRDRFLEQEVEENLCIDEQIIPFKGHLSIKQYIKNKPSPWGIKIFLLCGKSGRPYDFVAYQGSTTEIDPILMKAHGFSTAIVMKLVERIPLGNVGYKLYFDNYFSTYHLFQTLHSRGIYATGTIRVNRFQNPPLAKDAVLKGKGRGSSDQCITRDGNVIITKWYDNKAVHLASNHVGVGHQHMVKRWDKQEKVYVEVQQPEVVKLYNESMGGVDLLDQMLNYYRIFIKSRKWTLRVIMHFYDMAVVCSWFDYRNDCTKNDVPLKEQMDLLAFKYELAVTFASIGKVTPKRPGRPTTSLDEVIPRKRAFAPTPMEVRLDQIGHIPVFQNDANNSRCRRPGCKQKSYIMCQKCNVYLCCKRDANCFQMYHN